MRTEAVIMHRTGRTATADLAVSSAAALGTTDSYVRLREIM